MAPFSSEQYSYRGSSFNYGSFNDAVSSSDCTRSNDRMINEQLISNGMEICRCRGNI
jgi:hypothetical protein